MSGELNSREGLLTAVRSIRGEIDDIVHAASAMPPSRPRPGDSWTIEDLLAHVNGWRLRTAARLEAAVHGTEPGMPWPAPLDEDDDLDAINDWFVASNRGKSLSELSRESHETFDRIERAIAVLPEEDLFTSNRFSWLPGDALGPAVIGGTCEHHAEHLPEFRAMLEAKATGS